MPRRDLNLHPNFLQRKKCGFKNHSAMQPLRQNGLKINSVKVSFSAIHTVEPYGAVFIMNSKMHLRKNSSNEYFKTISHYLRVYSGFI